MEHANDMYYEFERSDEKMDEFIQVGKIINVHGIRGEVKIKPMTDDPQRFFSLDRVYIEKGGSISPLTISNVRIHKNHILATFHEITSRNEAEELKNLYLNIYVEDAIKLSKDQYFIYDLIGIRVYSLEGEFIGDIIDVLQTGPTDIYVIKASSKEILVPALKDIFKEIDIYKKIAKANIPEDLMEL